jgi:phosphomannomutase/phosphoglucomutase
LIADTVFKQYDLRGIIGTDFPLEDVYDLGKAIAVYFITRAHDVKTIAIGADGRIHSPIIKEKLCAALQDAGLNVVFIGVCPTPVLYFSLFTQPVQAGLMITASHNGKEYNGIKICLHKESVWGEAIQDIKKLYLDRIAISAPKPGEYKEHLLIPEYIQWLSDHFTHLKGMNISAVIDCGNGAAGTVLPALIKVMQWPRVQLLYAEVDGTYPHHEADPTVPENMQDVKHILATTDVQLGIGLDGDCDRMAPMTKEGKLIQGDVLLALFAREMLKKHPHAPIVFDIKCSSGLQELLEQWNAQPIMSPSGHSIIKNQMKEQQALLAGELSCHFFFKDRYFGYDDGIYALLRLFELLLASGKTLDELIKLFPQRYSTPEIRLACSQETKELMMPALEKSFSKIPGADVMTIDGIRVTMKHGWGMVRASNTQPVMCFRFEADSPEALSSIKKMFIDQVSPYFDEQALKVLSTA